MRMLLLATTALALGVGMAAAQDAVHDWSGAYVGAQAGYVRGDGHFTGAGDNAYPKPDGFIAGLYAGANYQFGNGVVAGIDADIAWSGADDRVPVYDSAGVPWPAYFRVVQEIHRTGAARLRLGFAIDRWLPYVAGGVAFADVAQRLVGADDDFNTIYTGWTLGAGTEYAFTDNMILRAEYRHSDFGTRTFGGTISPPLDIKLKTSNFRFGIAYKF